jgi:hypothetical protein
MKEGITRPWRWPSIPPAMLKYFISGRIKISQEPAPRQQFVVMITSTLFLRLSSRVSTEVRSNLKFTSFAKRGSSSPHNTLSLKEKQQLMSRIMNLLLHWVPRIKKGARATFVEKS